MTPFPEAEIMTIKRLEVALRKMDYKLLKDGAYKLHEKYHGGHKFEYLDLLKDIYFEVMQNSQVPRDVRDILCPTIEDILTLEGIDLELQPSDNYLTNQTRVSSLTSLSYTAQDSKENQTTPKTEPSEEPKMHAFDTFGTNNQTQQPQEKKVIIQSPFSAQPFREFSSPTLPSQNYSPIQTTTPAPEPSYQEQAIQSEKQNDITQEQQSNSLVSTPSYTPNYLRQYEASKIAQEEAKEENDFIQESIENESKAQFEQTFAPIFEEKTEEKVDETTEEVVIEGQKEEEIKFFEQPQNEYSQTNYSQAEQLQQEQNEKEITEEEVIKEEVIENSEIGKETEENKEVVEPIEEVTEIIEETVIEQEKKSVAVFYGQDSSVEKIKNILDLRELIIKNKDSASMSDISELISEISTQSNNNVIELQGVLEQLKNSGNKTNLITNSQSALFLELFKNKNISYSLYENEEDKDITFSPLYGLTNLFSCCECDNKHLVQNSEIKPIVLECPKCKNPMFPELYAPLAKAEIDIEYYNSSLIALANSKIWLLIHPSFNGKISSDLIESAFKVSSKVEEVYILDKDINVREAYKNIFEKINPNVKVNIHSTALEDFIKSI